MYDLYSDLYSKLGGNKNIEVAALNIHLGYEFVLLLTKFFHTSVSVKLHT